MMPMRTVNISFKEKLESNFRNTRKVCSSSRKLNLEQKKLQLFFKGLEHK